MHKQTERFKEAGCTIDCLNVAIDTPPTQRIVEAVQKADIVVVSGGNTLYAVDRWVKLGIDKLLRQAVERRVVMCGGSAGAICWFDSGHSDSMDPDSYRKNKLAEGSDSRDDSAAPESADDAKPWKYIRVNGMGFLPGLCCPHHDRVQSNGVLRAVDFDEMLQRHPGETGICIDHWAALVVNGDSYTVISPEGTAGSVTATGKYTTEVLCGFL
ncbi:hypothetical protein, variant [Sphaeroforma arctica JP610]|uniref:Peptidase S51 dipeptidase E n=1 Tax=Sphaeroforma arctica JP610 TaxID=667725 RepID=A0A0L0FBH5_9EUKA|nr:hypothetical protein, variant [Sphaeroforma arctica JP610]KNC74069.1 hypothetical protein, variant [Sphaeroforma arctica JP610]|eukprot:XP_014147971.1 hypothetical protein, variant [Sphaeroforma arctica JP610]